MPSISYPKMLGYLHKRAICEMTYEEFGEKFRMVGSSSTQILYMRYAVKNNSAKKSKAKNFRLIGLSVIPITSVGLDQPGTAKKVSTGIPSKTCELTGPAWVLPVSTVMSTDTPTGQTTWLGT